MRRTRGSDNDLASHLAGTQQGRFTHEPVSQQVKISRSLARGLPEHTAGSVEAYLDAVQSAFERRNDLVHSSFPAQPDGRLWGHRPTRDRTVTDGRADTVETNMEDLGIFIGQLARLVTAFGGIHALTTIGSRT